MLSFASISSASTKKLDQAAERIVETVFNTPVPNGAAVAVVPFRSQDGSISLLASLLSDKLTARIIKEKNLTVLDRRYVGRILGEVRLGASGLVDQSETIAIGKFTGARLMLLGSFVAADEQRVVINARLVETETGKIFGSAREELKLNDELQGLYSKTSIADTLAEEPFETKSDDAVLIDREGKGCSWVKSSGSAEITNSQPWARAMAITLARQKAVNKAGGKSPNWGLPSNGEYLASNLENVLRASRSGNIAEERIVLEKKEKQAYSVILEACVKPTRANVDKSFKVELLLSQASFKDGDKARIVVSVSTSAQVYVYSIDLDGKALLVFPYAGTNASIEPGHPLVFPGETHEQAGTTLEAELPTGADSSFETLRVFAVKGAGRSLLDGAHSYPDLVSRLEASDADWAEDVRVFSIHR